LGENSREIKISLSKTMNVQPDKKIAASLKITKYEIVVPFELRINDTISGNTNSVMGTLAVTLYRSPSIESANVSDLQNC